MTKTITIDWKKLQLVYEREFCPKGLKFDPEDPLLLRILSSCETEGQFSESHIFTVNVMSRDFKEKYTLNSKLNSAASFCSFKESYTLVSTDRKKLLFFAKKNNLNRIEFDLGGEGWNEIEEVSCLGSAGIMSVLGKSKTESKFNIAYLRADRADNKDLFALKSWAEVDRTN